MRIWKLPINKKYFEAIDMQTFKLLESFFNEDMKNFQTIESTFKLLESTSKQ